MEELSDSLSSNDFSRILNENFPEEQLEAETSGENGKKFIDNLISQLTGTIPAKSTDSRAHDFDLEKDSNEDFLKLQDPPNIDEILNTEESLIKPNSHNVSVINAACQQILRQMEHQLVTLLKKNRKEQDIVQEFLNANCKSSYFQNKKKCSAKCAGIPYFKDSYGFQPPPNEDVLKKKKNNKLLPTDFIKSFSTWNTTDAKNLVKAVEKYNISKPSEIDWMKVSASDMEGKYSPSECKSKWIMHLHPSVNKSRWNSKEVGLLKLLSAKYNYQNWEKIAAELGTNRTSLQCCIQYHTHTFPTEGKWTKEEDKTLLKLVDRFKVKDFIPWKKIVWYFENRSLKQCQERYAYHLGNIKKGSFTMEEDFVIVYLASKLKNFGKVAKFLPKRVATQVRSRYEYLVQLSMPPFTKEEDELLTKLIAQYPRNWGKISENFKNRSRVQCRKRWADLQKKIQLKDDFESEEENEEILDFSTDSNKGESDKKELDSEIVKNNFDRVVKPAGISMKYPKIYEQLLDYHKYCHKFLFGPKARIPANSDEVKKLIVKMLVTMKTLSVNATLSNKFNISSLSNDCTFDREDFLILNELKNREQEERSFKLSEKIIPPNYMTLLALRTFTLGWDKIKELCKFYKSSPQSPSQINSNDRLLCTDAKKLFKSRLKTIFAFPLIISNISPQDKLIPVSKAKVRKAVKPLSKRKRREHAKFMSAIYRNKIKALGKKFEDPSFSNLEEPEECLELNPNKKKKRLKPFDGKGSKPLTSETFEENENLNSNKTQISRKREHSQSEKVMSAPLKKQRVRRSTRSRNSK